MPATAARCRSAWSTSTPARPSCCVVAVTVLIGDSALQLQVFAAPRNEAIWADVRKELAAQITKDGGLADVDETEAGTTLRAQLPMPQPDGSVALGAVRFIGTDGP